MLFEGPFEPGLALVSGLVHKIDGRVLSMNRTLIACALNLDIGGLLIKHPQ